MNKYVYLRKQTYKYEYEGNVPIQENLSLL